MRFQMQFTGFSAVFLTSLLFTFSACGDPLAGYTLIWAEEFDGTALDSCAWVYRSDNKHWSVQRPENVEVADGFLHLHLKKEAVADKAYSGAGVISKAAFRHGYFEARFTVPSGAGWHTSFWLMKHNGSGGTTPSAATHEIDICEHDSITPDAYSINLHQWRETHIGRELGRVLAPVLADGFHVYGCKVTEDSLHFFFDGIRVLTEAYAISPQSEHHIWLTSIASHLGDTERVDDSALPSAAVFDYVRVYQSEVGSEKMHTP
ncbi:glycoside hydrolase family 16 protein [candidate division KSB1 bacterium]|nr:glycoside hydrolase family 16 protein [candidate division KSB1 bacterium]